MRIGIFGGTFDPPHAGHLIVAQDVHEALGLDRVFFVPARIPPHKQDEEVAPAELRLEMLRASVGDDPRFGVSDLELRREGPSYTVDTLRELRERRPDDEIHLIIGTDQLRDFATWREPEEIVRLARLAVMARNGLRPERADPSLALDDAVRSDPGVVVAGEARVGLPVEVEYDTVEVTRVDLSSTEIRRRVAAGRPIRYLVPGPVEEIIRREALYG